MGNGSERGIINLPSADRYTPTLKEREAFRTIGIFDETDPLEAAVIWGGAGAESYLAQLYPPSISLFLEEMNVVRAREEAAAFAETLRDHGVHVLTARDTLSEIIPPKKLLEDEVLRGLIGKARQIQEQYGKKPNGNTAGETIEMLLDLDIGKYGEERALTLNHVLSLAPSLPMGNVIYSRDQMNVLLGRRIVASMAKDIRRPEVGLYELIYGKLLGLKNPIFIPNGERFEGGDPYIHDRVIYIGVGTRTTMGAAIHIYRELARDISDLGFRFAVVADELAVLRSEKEQMNFMHLDTFSYPIGPRQMELCLREGSQRRVIFLETHNGEVVLRKTGKTFLEYLSDIGEQIFDIPPEEQQAFGCNNLALNERDIIVPLDTNGKTLSQLQKAGKNVIYVPLIENTKGYGAAHCMIGQLRRRRGN